MGYTSSMRNAQIARCSTGALSTFSSFLLVIFILSSPTGLKSPYSRIIFGLSIADVLQSLGIVVGPFAAPTDPNHIFGRGNEQSCDAIGFFTVIGSLAVPWYTVHLTYYFLKRVKYKVKPRDFANGEEKWLHTLIWIFSITVSSYSFGKQMINPTQGGSMCYLTAYPAGCERDDDVECIRGKGATITATYSIIIPLVLIFASLLTVLAAFTFHVYRSEKQLQPVKHDHKKTKEKEQNIPREVSDEEDTGDSKNQNKDEQDKLSAHERYQKQALELVLTKSAILQSTLYIIAFLFVYSGPFLVVASGFTHSEVIFWWFSIFYPLGGLFNMIIYTRPKVQALRKVLPEIPRFLGFLIVLTSGGETPNVMDLLSSLNEGNNNTAQYQGRNSALERACRVFGFDHDYVDDLEAEVERAMRGEFSLDSDTNEEDENPISVENSSVYIETRRNQQEINAPNSLLQLDGGLSSCLSAEDETFQDEHEA